MGIKTDYLKDCITGNSITIQDLINLKGSINNIPDNNSIADQLSATIQKLEAQIDIELQQTKKEITIPAKKVVKFKAGSELASAVK